MPLAQSMMFKKIPSFYFYYLDKSIRKYLVEFLWTYVLKVEK